jgi:hypothetical protein
MLRTSLAACGLLCTAISAQSFSYPDFSSTAQLNLLGNSVQTGNSIRLTANASNQTGWFWRQTAVPLVNGFDTTFTFRILPPSPGTKAEGMALVIHNDPNGASAMGGTVWGMGYGAGANSNGGIRNSIAIELDTYLDPFLNDSSANELTIHTRGTSGNNENELYSIGRVTPPGNFVNGQVHTVRVVYVPGTISVYVDNPVTPVLTRAYSLVTGGTWTNGTAVGGIGSASGTGYAGFCATTGAGTLTEQVDILSWTWVSTPFTDACYNGTLGDDTLTINGSSGDFSRRVEVATYQPFGINVANPPGYGVGAPYVLVGSLFPSPGAIGTALGFGNACFPMLPIGPAEIILANTFGIGTGLLPALPTPHTIAIPTGVITFPLELTLQAVTFDTASPLTLGLTNAVELAIVPVGPPSIANVLPSSSAATVPVTVSGVGFVPGLTLTVAGAPVVPTSVTPTAVTFDYPAGASCDSSLVLRNPDGQTVSWVLNPTPVVTNTILGSGTTSGGAIFVVQGTGFSAGTTVTIGGAAANVLSAGSSAVSMQTPPGTAGVATVILTTPGGCQASTTYTYQ